MKYITHKDFEKCNAIANDAIKDIPSNHCRKRIKTYNRVLMEAIECCKSRSEGPAEIGIYYYHSNLGNMTYPEVYKHVSTFKIKDYTETEHTFSNRGCRTRILKSTVLACIKK